MSDFRDTSDLSMDESEIQGRAAEHGEPTSEQVSRQANKHNKREKREYRGQMLNRWPRAFARLFDLLWEIPVALFALLLLASKTGSGSVAIGSIEFLFVLFLALPLALLLDAIIAGIFSNTPAKAIIGVKATSSRGERLDLRTHLRRNFGVWTDGLSLGIAPITIFSMLRQFKRVSGRREAIYDERLHVRVRSGRMTGVRVLIPLLLFIGGLAAVVLMT